MKRRYVLILVYLLILFGVAGCGKVQENNDKVSDDSKEPKSNESNLSFICRYTNVLNGREDKYEWTFIFNESGEKLESVKEELVSSYIDGESHFSDFNINQVKEMCTDKYSGFKCEYNVTSDKTTENLKAVYYFKEMDDKSKEIAEAEGIMQFEDYSYVRLKEESKEVCE